MIRTVFNACLASICALLFTLQASAVVRELDRIVAVVEDDVVLGSELITRLTTVREQMEAADITPPPNEVLLNQILERLITESIQLQEAARRGIEIDDESLTSCLLYTSPSPRDKRQSRMPSSA